MKKSNMMIKLRAFGTFGALAVFAALLAACTPTREKAPAPSWVSKIPQDKEVLWLVGRSDPVSQAHSYAEAKAGALADVLLQLAFYRDIQIQSMTTDYEVTGNIGDADERYQEVVSQLITTDLDTANLYQASEWIDDEGRIAVLYRYPRQNGGVFGAVPLDIARFNKVTPASGRLYFIGSAVSVKNSKKELLLIAEEDAKLQILLFLGGTSAVTLMDYSAYAEPSGEEQNYFEISISLNSDVDIGAALSREQELYQRETDKKYYCYVLYSVDVGFQKNKVPAREIMAYSITGGKGGEGEGEIETKVTKDTAIYGGSFTRTLESALTAPAAEGETLPPFVLNSPLAEDEMYGVGAAAEFSYEAETLLSAVRAVVSIARSVGTSVQSMITDHKADSADGGEATPVQESTTQILTVITLSSLEKTEDTRAGGTECQMWAIPKAVAERAMQEAAQQRAAAGR
jgi:hypothetical protein